MEMGTSNTAMQNEASSDDEQMHAASSMVPVEMRQVPKHTVGTQFEFHQYNDTARKGRKPGQEFVN